LVGGCTLVAPTDAAFRRLGYSAEELLQFEELDLLLRYHVALKSISYKTITSNTQHTSSENAAGAPAWSWKWDATHGTNVLVDALGNQGWLKPPFVETEDGNTLIVSSCVLLPYELHADGLRFATPDARDEPPSQADYGTRAGGGGHHHLPASFVSHEFKAGQNRWY